MFYIHIPCQILICTGVQPPDDRAEEEEWEAQRQLALVANVLSLPESDGSSTAPAGSSQSSLNLIALSSQHVHSYPLF